MANQSFTKVVAWLVQEGEVMGAIPMRAEASGTTLRPEDILTVEELSRRLKVGKAWVYEKSRARGQFGGEAFPTLRCGKYLRFEWPAVVEWLRRNGGK